jgi:hypothetical protein
MREEVRRGWWDGDLVDEFERMISTTTFSIQESEVKRAF